MSYQDFGTNKESEWNSQGNDQWNYDYHQEAYSNVQGSQSEYYSTEGPYNTTKDTATYGSYEGLYPTSSNRAEYTESSIEMRNNVWNRVSSNADEAEVYSTPTTHKDDGEGEWEEHEDNSGHIYYFNRLTGESSWDKPQGYGDTKTVTEAIRLVAEKEFLASQNTKLMIENAAKAQAEREALEAKMDQEELHGRAQRDAEDLLRVAECCTSKQFMQTFLLREGGRFAAQINTLAGNKGYSSLHVACQKNKNLDIIQMLIDSGANINIRSEHGYTPLELAKMNNRSPNLLQLLSIQGAKEGSKIDAAAKAAEEKQRKFEEALKIIAVKTKKAQARRAELEKGAEEKHAIERAERLRIEKSEAEAKAKTEALLAAAFKKKKRGDKKPKKRKRNRKNK